MSEIEDSREYCHMKVATFKDWLLNVEEDFINVDVHKDPSSNDTSNPNGSTPQQQNISDFEFEKEEKQHSTAATTADELFLEGKLLPLETVQKHRQNNNAAAIDNVRSQSAIEDRTIPRTNTMSPSHSRRFSCSDANPFEYQFQFSADFTKTSWSPRLTKQTKQSWLVQKLKASRAFIKSLFTKSEKGKSCPSSASAFAADNNINGDAGNKPTPPNHRRKDKNAEDNIAAAGEARKGSFEMLDESELHRSCAVAINIVHKGMHDHGLVLGGSSRSRRSSLSGVLKRQFSSRGSSFSLSAAGCNESKVLKSAAHHYHDPEKSVNGAIEHCRLSQQMGVGFGSGLRIAPKVAASGNLDVAPPPGKTEC